MSQTVSVTLPTSTVYVSGTVNGIDRTWTNTSGQTWEAVADRAEDDIYHVELTIISVSGTSTEVSLTLYYGVLNLITDRTQADVRRWEYLAAKRYSDMTEEEHAEWDAGMKGSYNATDLNRVGAAVQYIANRFSGFGYGVTVNPKQDWTMADIPTPDDMMEYLSDISTLREVFSVMPTTPHVPDDMDRLNYMEANNIEQILKDIDLLLGHMVLAWFYSGDIYSGEV